VRSVEGTARAAGDGDVNAGKCALSKSRAVISQILTRASLALELERTSKFAQIGIKSTSFAIADGVIQDLDDMRVAKAGLKGRRMYFDDQTR